MEKLYITYNQIHETVKSLSQEIISADFKPDLIIAIGTGGFIPARMIKTYLNRSIQTVGIAYYDLNNIPSEKPVITQWLDGADEKLKGKKILLVDEVDDSRATIGFCLEELQKHDPEEIAVMVIHNKKKKKAREIPPQIRHYFIGENFDDQWICYPWDAENIAEHDSLSLQAGLE